MRLGGEDTAWLHMSDETNPMIVNAVIELDGTLDTARVWSIVETRGLPPRFRARVVDRGRGLPELEPDPTFDVAKHLVHVEIEPGDDALREFVSREVSTMLDRRSAALAHDRHRSRGRADGHSLPRPPRAR